MEKESNFFCIAVLITGALVSLTLLFIFPGFSSIFLGLTVLFALLAALKWINQLRGHLSYPIDKIICWTHSIAFEILVLTASFLLRPLGYIQALNQRCGQKKGTPILLIHGYLQNASNWTYIKRYLSKKGFGPIYTLNLTPPFRSIGEFSELVSKKAQQIAQETGSKDLILIGHSMGGLVSLWYAVKIAPRGTVKKLITIGSPIAGTHLARVAIGPNGKEMRRGSQFTEELKQKLRQNNQIPIYHIGSKADQIIIPYSSALTGLNLEREYLVEDLGHMTLLGSPRVARKIENWLNE